jgi:hypothetical protein
LQIKATKRMSYKRRVKIKIIDVILVATRMI